jgi:hypothetical protein
MRVLAATIAAGLLVVIAATAASAAPARSGKLTGPEQKWATPVIQVWNLMNDGLGKVSAQTTASRALEPGTAANKKLVTTLGNFVACTPAMKKLENPPTARLKRFSASMKGACAHLGKGAHGVANGVSTIYKQNNAKLATLQITAAFKEFQKGSTQLATARRQLLAIGGKGFKG